MAKLLRLLRNLGIALAVLAGLGWVAIYGMSESILRKRWVAPPVSIAVPGDAAAIERGRHLALTRGCLSCHGERLEGSVFFEEKHIARLAAPNLARLARERPVEQLERAIRRGIRPDGTTVRGMPSETFFELSDADLGALIAYLRSQPPVEHALPETEVWSLGRVGLATGKYRLAPQLIDPTRARREPAPGDPLSEGRYLARTTCVECHGLDLHGAPEGPEPTPNLALVASYAPEQFERLMRTGVPAGGQKLKLMAAVAQGRFAHFTDGEVAALYQYLRLLADPSAADRL